MGNFISVANNEGENSLFSEVEKVVYYDGECPEGSVSLTKILYFLCDMKIHVDTNIIAENLDSGRKKLEAAKITNPDLKNRFIEAFEVVKMDYTSGRLWIRVYVTGIVTIGTLTICITKTGMNNGKNVFDYTVSREYVNVMAYISNLMRVIADEIEAIYTAYMAYEHLINLTTTIPSCNSSLSISVGNNKLTVLMDSDPIIAFRSYQRSDRHVDINPELQSFLAEKEDDFLSNLFVNINDCPEWMRPFLTTEIANPVENKKGNKLMRFINSLKRTNSQ